MFSRFYRVNRFFIESLEESSRYDFYFDGCKVLNRLELLRTAIRDIKVIHMIRHPGGILYHDQKAGVSMADYRLSQWARYHRRARSFLPLIGESNYFAVPYEAIVQRPAHFFERVVAFLGATEWEIEDPSVIDRSKAHILGNKMRENVQRIVDYSNVWRDHLPPEEIARADSVFDEHEWMSGLYAEWDCDLGRAKSPLPS
jgi:hypothetical protein